jgi:hypothetical protein
MAAKGVFGAGGALGVGPLRGATADLESIDENGGGPGVRLRKRHLKKGQRVWRKTKLAHRPTLAAVPDSSERN